MKEKPYIGVTGITTMQEAEVVVALFNNRIPGSTHEGMVGYLVSWRTLYGQGEKSTKYPDVELLPEMMASSSLSSDYVKNAIHYKTTDQSTLAEQIKRLLSNQGLYDTRLCRILQLNMSWPDITQLDQLKQHFADLKLILRIGPRILSQESYVDIANKLTDYGAYINYVLLDPSGGRAQSFSADALVPLYRAIRHHLPQTPIIFAGGFSDQNLNKRLIELGGFLRHRQFGIDSEGGLRVTSRHPHVDHLLLSRVNTYIARAALFFRP